MNKGQLIWMLVFAIVFGVFMGVPAVAVIKTPGMADWVIVMFEAGGLLFWIGCLACVINYFRLPQSHQRLPFDRRATVNREYIGSRLADMTAARRNS